MPRLVGGDITIKRQNTKITQNNNAKSGRSSDTQKKKPRLKDRTDLV